MIARREGMLVESTPMPFKAPVDANGGGIEAYGEQRREARRSGQQQSEKVTEDSSQSETRRECVSRTGRREQGGRSGGHGIASCDSEAERSEHLGAILATARLQLCTAMQGADR